MVRTLQKRRIESAQSVSFTVHTSASVRSHYKPPPTWFRKIVTDDFSS